MGALAITRPQVEVAGRPSTIGLVLGQILYAFREMWRSRFVVIFTFVLPVLWLVIVGMLAGNDAVDEATGVRVMQFVTPTAIVMGVLYATLPTVAQSLALGREQGLVKRLRATPLPLWAYLLGRVGASVLLATAAVVVMLVLGLIAYDVQVQWRSVVASAITLIVGAACLSSVGLAVGALASSASVAQTVGTAVAVGITFLSGMFVIGTTPPGWMVSTGSLFPVRPLLVALQDQFNPFLTGGGWDGAPLAMSAGWGIAALAIAVWSLRRERRSAGVRARALEQSSVAAGRTLRSLESGRPSDRALMVDQVAWASRAAMRDVAWVLFAVGMPVVLYAFMCSVYAGGSLRLGRHPFEFAFASGMAVYGAGVTAFVNVPEAVAQARDRRLLKRLRGTPLTSLEYLVGRVVSALWIAVLTGLLVYAVGIAFFDLRIAGEGVPLAIAIVLLGTMTMAACGFALAAVLPNARATAVGALVILLPLSFFSDIFVFGTTPPLMSTIGSLFPLKHLVAALSASLDPAGISVAWGDLAVVVVWLALATAVAVRRFRWEPAR